MWIAVRLLATIVVLLSLAACAAPNGPTQNPSASGQSAATTVGGAPKRITTIIRGNPFALATMVNEASTGSTPGVDQVEQLLNAGLTATDAKGQLQPRLAEQVPTVENGNWRVFPDGQMETTWRLKPGSTWHDGTPLTAEDFVFAIRVAQEPRTALTGGAVIAQIERAEALDDRTVRVTWKTPYIGADGLFATAPSSELRQMPLPRHLIEQPFLDDPTSFGQLAYWTKSFVGVGPFRLQEYLEGSHMLLRANDNYLLGRPKVDEVEVRFMSDPNTIAANLLADAADLTMNSRLSIDWGAQVRDHWANGHLEPLINGNLVSLFPQLLTPNPALVGMTDFRAALLHATDRQQLSESIQAGLAPVADSLVGPTDTEFAAVDPSVVKYAYDQRRAFQLLDGLGLTRGQDGYYRDSSGQRITVELRSRQGDDLQEKMLTAVADMWQRVGIASDQLIFPAQRANDREFRATFPGFEVVRQPGGARALPRFHSSEIGLPENSFRGNNRSRYRNPEFDTLIDRYTTTIPVAERNQVLAQAMNLMTRNLVSLPLNLSVDATMISNRLRNIESGNVAWNAHEWDVQ